MTPGSRAFGVLVVCGLIAPGRAAHADDRLGDYQLQEIFKHCLKVVKLAGDPTAEPKDIEFEYKWYRQSYDKHDRFSQYLDATVELDVNQQGWDARVMKKLVVKDLMAQCEKAYTTGTAAAHHDQAKALVVDALQYCATALNRAKDRSLVPLGLSHYIEVFNQQSRNALALVPSIAGETIDYDAGRTDAETPSSKSPKLTRTVAKDMIARCEKELPKLAKVAQANEKQADVADAREEARVRKLARGDRKRLLAERGWPTYADHEDVLKASFWSYDTEDGCHLKFRFAGNTAKREKHCD
jgi:hypothetical protein